MLEAEDDEDFIGLDAIMHPSENVEHASLRCADGYTSIDQDCYSLSDLAVLDTFIKNSNGSINLILDQNGNGIIETLELCIQEWHEGRLISLDCSPMAINDVYNWLDISGEVPDSISTLTDIEILIMSYNDLSGLVPDSMCDLNLEFSDSSIFSLYGNDLCPPYPECIEDYMGMQSNFGMGSCEVSNCYDVGVTDIALLEIAGDDLVNPYEDFKSASKLLVNVHNGGPDCSAYPGLMITADTTGTSFPTAEETPAVNWWYAIFADDTYFSEVTFEISPYVPVGTEITLTAKAITMGCSDEGCSDDPYCQHCPLTDPMQITLTVGDPFPHQLGDTNLDGDLNILDVTEIVSLIINDNINFYDGAQALTSYMSDMNQDNQVNVIDVISLINIILASEA